MECGWQHSFRMKAVLPLDSDFATALGRFSNARVGCLTKYTYEYLLVIILQMSPGPVLQIHYNDVIMGAIASQITSLTIAYSIVFLGADQRKHQSSASLAFVWGIHRWPVNSPHKGPVMRKMFPFDDVIMWWLSTNYNAAFNESCDHLVLGQCHIAVLIQHPASQMRNTWMEQQNLQRTGVLCVWSKCYCMRNTAKCVLRLHTLCPVTSMA